MASECEKKTARGVWGNSTSVEKRNIHWLAKLRITIPEDLAEMVSDYGCLKIGYYDGYFEHGGIVLKLSPRTGSGIQPIVADIHYCRETSAGYTNLCRMIAHEPEKIRSYLEDYLNR
jgi:hypothetical protein